MDEAGSARGAAAAVVSCVAAVACLVALEGSAYVWLAAWPVLPLVWASLRWGTAWTLAVTTVLLCDVSLWGAGADTLGARVYRLRAEALWRATGDPRRVRGTCPEFRFREGDGVDGAPPRDARGWRVVDVPGQGDPLRIALVGDSVPYRGVARLLEEAGARAQVALHIVDTTVYDYRLTDYVCILDELAATETVDLTLTFVVTNDLPHALLVDLPPGPGEGSHDLMSWLPEDLDTVRFAPLLASSSNPWIIARRDALRARFGTTWIEDFRDGSVFADDASHFADPAWVRMGASHELRARLAARGAGAVLVPVPMIYEGEPDPLRTLWSPWIDAVADGGHVVVDPWRALRRFRYEDLAAVEVAEVFAGKGVYDPLHYGDAGLAVITELALAHVDRDTASLRGALAELATERLPCGGWVCRASVPAGGPGVHDPNPPCAPAPRTCPE